MEEGSGLISEIPGKSDAGYLGGKKKEGENEEKEGEKEEEKERNGVLRVRFSGYNVEMMDLLYYFPKFKKVPYFMLTSKGYKLFIPFELGQKLSKNPEIWRKVQFNLGGDAFRTHSINVPIFGLLPRTEEEVFAGVRSRSALLISKKDFRAINDDRRVKSKRTIISYATNLDGSRIFDIDFRVLHPSTIKLFNHISSLQHKISLRSRNIWCLKLFFSHFDIELDLKTLEKFTFVKSKGNSTKYIKCLMKICSVILRKCRKKSRTLPSKPNVASKDKEAHVAAIQNISSLSSSKDHLKFTCPKCLIVKQDRASFLEHMTLIEYKRILADKLSSYDIVTKRCPFEGCEKSVDPGEKDLKYHLGVDHEHSFDIFRDEMSKKIKTCVVKDCTFLTISLQSALTHMIYAHFNNQISEDLRKAQSIVGNREDVCPYPNCGLTFEERKLFVHYAVEHGTFLEFLPTTKPYDISRFIELAEYRLFGQIQSLCQMRFFKDIRYFRTDSYLKRQTSGLENKPLHGFSLQNDLSQEDFNGEKSGLTPIERSISGSILGAYSKCGPKQSSSWFLKLYDLMGYLFDLPAYLCCNLQFKSLSQLRRHFMIHEIAEVKCIACRHGLLIDNCMKSPSLLFAHLISQEHLHNRWILMNSSPTTFNPVKLAQGHNDHCLLCNKKFTEEHIFNECHILKLKALIKYVIFCYLTNVSPVTCSIDECFTYLKYVYATLQNRTSSLHAMVRIISMVHEFVENIPLINNPLLMQKLSEVVGPPKNLIPAIFTCYPCTFTAASSEDIVEHFNSLPHLYVIAERQKKKYLENYCKCETCGLFFSMPQCVSFHRHTEKHLRTEYSKRYNTVIQSLPVSGLQQKNNPFFCILCNLEVLNGKIKDHVSHPFHVQSETLADEFYSYCSNLRTCPLTCPKFLISSYFQNYDDNSRPQARKIVERILRQVDDGSSFFEVDLSSHLYSAILDNKTINEVLKCSECMELFKHATQLSYHVREEHSRWILTDFQIKSRNNLIKKCDKCSLFFSPFLLALHYDQHECFLSCEVCGKTYFSPFQYYAYDACSSPKTTLFPQSVKIFVNTKIYEALKRQNNVIILDNEKSYPVKIKDWKEQFPRILAAPIFVKIRFMSKLKIELCTRIVSKHWVAKVPLTELAYNKKDSVRRKIRREILRHNRRHFTKPKYCIHCRKYSTYVVFDLLNHIQDCIKSNVI